MVHVRASLASALLLGSIVLGPALLAPPGAATPGDYVATATVPVPASIGVGLTFDGHTFYYTNYQDPTLYGYTVSCAGSSCSTTLTLTQAIRDATTLSPVSVGAIAYDATRGVIWGGADGSSAIYRIDPATGLATFAFTASACGSSYGLVDGIAFDAQADTIYYSPDVSYSACAFSPAGSLLDQVPVASVAGFPACYNSGLAIGGDVLYMGSDGCGQIVAVDKASHQGLGVFASPGGRDEGMTCDPVTFAPQSVIWSKDAYNNRATAFEIAPGTCGVGGLPPCTADVAAQIDDPQPGFDYYGGGKQAQSPQGPLPRVAGVVTLRAEGSPAGRATRADFRVDGALVGSSDVEPFAVSWDASSVSPGAHSLTVALEDDAGCPTQASQAFLVTCGAPIAVDVSRPAAGTTYFQDAAHPGAPGPAVVLGDLTLEAAASDPSRIVSVDWSVDGNDIATGVVGAPWSAPWQASAASPGLHTIRALFHETNGGCTDLAVATAKVSLLRDESSAQGVFATVSQPAEPTLVSHPVEAPGESWVVDRSFDPLGLRVQASHDEADDAPGAAHAASEVANVSLLGGTVTAKLLRGEVALSLDAADLSLPYDASGSRIVDLAVNGLPVAAQQPNTRVDLPGVGHLVLNEQIVTDAPGHREVQVNALHLYADVNGLRGEVVLGSALVGIDDALGSFAGRAHEIDPQDDAGSGHDAGDAPASGLVLPVGQGGTDLGATLVGGRLGPYDPADHYLVRVAEGEKLLATLKPAEAATVGLATLGTPPAPPGASVDSLAIPQQTLRLLEPSDRRVATESALPLSAPQRVDLNVNETGLWDLVVAGDVGNYTLQVSVVPAPLAPPAAAGASCGDASAPFLEASGAASSFHAHDINQVWRLNASIGDDVGVELVMPDPDGQDFDLTLYDDACHVLAQSQLGKPLFWPGDAPKGISDFVAPPPAPYTGVYWVEATRVTGAGNFALLPQVASPIPTIPGNDALTGQDASNDPSSPTALPLSEGVFEGRFEDHDPADVYSVPLSAGERLLVTFVPSPANTGTMEITGAGISIDRQEDVGGRVAFQLTAPAGQDGSAVITLRPTLGGGNYALAVIHK